MIGDSAQYQELSSLYSSYGDRELVQLAGGLSDLTEMAQEALKGELSRRGLKVPSAGQPESAQIFMEEDSVDMRIYADSAPPECIFEFRDEKTASGAYEVLARRDIEAILISASRAKFDNRGPRVVVFPNDAERAAAILSQQSAEQLKAEDEPLEDFELPLCPACGGQETMLESVDPANKWRCEGCDHVWLDDAAPTL